MPEKTIALTLCVHVVLACVCTPFCVNRYTNADQHGYDFQAAYKEILHLMRGAFQEVQCWDLAPESTVGAPAPPGAASSSESRSPEGVEQELRERRQENSKNNFHEVSNWWPSAANGRLFSQWRAPANCGVAILDSEFQEHYRWTSPGVPAELGPSGFFQGQARL